MNTSRNNRRWKNRPLVRERDAQRARWLWLLLAGIVAALAPTGLYLYEQNSCLQLSYELESIEGQRERLAEVERRLEVSHAAVASMQNIERWAARKKFERPAGAEIVVVPFEAVAAEPVLAQVPDGPIPPAPNRQRRTE